jgi:hypothetical protein
MDLSLFIPVKWFLLYKALYVLPSSIEIRILPGDCLEEHNKPTKIPFDNLL